MDTPHGHAQASPLEGRKGPVGIVFAALLAFAPVLANSLAHAQDKPPLLLTSEFRNVPAEKERVLFSTPDAAPELDGKLTEPAWRRRAAETLGPDMRGGTASRESEVRLYHDDHTLYVGFECREPAMDSIPLATEIAHDRHLSEDFRVCIAPDDVSNHMFIFAVGPNGARYDWNSREGIAWNPEWQSHVVRETKLWRGEIAIPFETLGMDIAEPGTVWRFNLCRHVAVTNETCSWCPTDDNPTNRNLWGYLVFGERSAWNGLPKSSAIEIAPDRWELGASDYALRLALRIRGEALPEKASLRVRVLRPAAPTDSAETDDAPAQPRTVAARTLPAKGNRANLVVNAKALPAGDFSLKATLLAEDGKTLAEGQIALSKKPPQPETAPSPVAEGAETPPTPPERIELHVPQYAVKTALANRWPICTAAAIPRGALYETERVRLLGPDSREVPCQPTVRARWPGDGSIRWLGLDFRADIRRPGGTRYTLEYGPHVTRAPFTGFVRDPKWRHLPFEPVEQEWLINTGPLLLTVHADRFTGIHEAWVDVDGNGFYDWNEQIVNATRFTEGHMPGPGPYIADANGWTYRFMSDPKIRLNLEEWNELRLVLRGEARLLLDRDTRPETGRAPPGSDMGRCVMRIVAYAGMPFIRVQVRFFLNSTAANNPIGDIGVANRLDYHEDFDAVLGLPGGFRKSIRETGPVSLMKLQPNSYRVFQPDAEDPVTAQADGAENWACAAAGDRGVAVCIRDMDKFFPKEIEICPEGALVTHLWPAHGSEALRKWDTAVDRRTLGALGFAHNGRSLDLRSPSAFAQRFTDVEGLAEIDVIGDMQRADATGIAVAADLLYIFYSGILDEREISEIARAFQMAPHAVQDRDSLVKSGVLPEMLPPDRAERAAALARKLLEDEGEHEQAGMFNYLDLHGRRRVSEDRWDLHDHWVAARGDVPGMLWSLYLQTSLPELYLAADRNLAHVAAVDFCHESTADRAGAADPRARTIAGAFGDARTPVHWQGRYHLNDRFARIRGPQLSYYLAGNPWAIELIRAWGDAVKRRGVPADGLDGAVFLDNLRLFLRNEYDGVLHDKSAECASYLFSTPFVLDEQPGWRANVRDYAAQTRDRRAVEFLNGLRPGPEVRQSFDMLCLLRDLYAATGDASYSDDAAKLIADFEHKADTVLDGGASPSDAGITWEALSVYVFGAAEPVGR